MALGRGERLRGAPLFAPPPDMTTPLGLSRQHLSYLQEIGSGWFGKVSGAGGGRQGGSVPFRAVLLFCVHPPCSHHLSSVPCPSAHPVPSPLSASHLLPPTPSPPHLSVGASLLTPLTTLPRHLALHASVCPSFHPSLHPSDSGPVSLSPCV